MGQPLCTTLKIDKKHVLYYVSVAELNWKYKNNIAKTAGWTVIIDFQCYFNLEKIKIL